jgi:excinuclease ABC subunit B
VSCIYGIGSVEDYDGLAIRLKTGERRVRDKFLRQLTDIQYQRNDIDFHRSTFRVRGDVVDVFPAGEELAYRIEFFGDEVEVISEVDPLRGIRLNRLPKMTIFPASHYVTSLDLRHGAMQTIRTELREHLMQLKEQNKLLEAQRLEQRTMYDLEMIEQIGFCQGIENYSRHLTGRPPGAAPPTLLEYFPKDWLLFVDESHVTVPQIGGMYRGDRARKMNLVEHGFRLPSALDNRPLNFEEWEKCLHQTIYVSATPGDYELKKSSGEIVEQVIRPTGLVDPLVEVRPAGTQVDNLLTEIRLVLKRGFRVLVTTLTKKLAEDLTDYYSKEGIRVKYLHSDIDTMERVEILRDLRLGTFDVLVGINLLREGLDLPEVALVAILDADKEGFLRSSRSLIQTIGRAARNSEGTVILYADKITDSMQIAMNETARRRSIQEAHNEEHHIAPRTIQKEIKAMLPESELELNEDGTSKKRSMKQILGLGSTRSQRTQLAQESTRGIDLTFLDGLDEISKQEKIKELAGEFYSQDVRKIVHQMEKAMRAHAQSMEFEKAAALRDRLKQLRLLSI